MTQRPALPSTSHKSLNAFDMMAPCALLVRTQVYGHPRSVLKRGGNLQPLQVTCHEVCLEPRLSACYNQQYPCCRCCLACRPRRTGSFRDICEAGSNGSRCLPSRRGDHRRRSCMCDRPTCPELQEGGPCSLHRRNPSVSKGAVAGRDLGFGSPAVQRSLQAVKPAYPAPSTMTSKTSETLAGMLRRGVMAAWHFIPRSRPWPGR